MSESPPILCTLLSEAWKYGTEEDYQIILEKGDSAYALHHSWLCWDREPCVVICWGCNSKNIVSILVHETIHHVLLWINGEGCEDEDHLNDIERFLEENEIKMKEFPV